MLDLLITHATLPDGRTDMSLAVQDGRFVDITAGPLQAPAHQVLDAGGQLVSPPFVDAHFHMDATLSYGMPRVNQSGTLLEGIALWGELKPHLTQEAVVERALAYCDWAVAKGLLAIRSHVDTSDPRMLAVEALLEVKRRVTPYLDLQLVAFPQDGVLRAPGGVDNLQRALDLGVDVVGGIPHFERTMADGAESVRLLCETAATSTWPFFWNPMLTRSQSSRTARSVASAFAAAGKRSSASEVASRSSVLISLSRVACSSSD